MVGPPAFFESRTPTTLSTNATSTQLLSVPPLWLLLCQLTSTQLSVPLPPL